MSLVLDEHQEYLADRVRVSAFRRALRKVVRPRDVVLDVGAGTAILGMLACEAGAAKVYSVDAGGIAQLARELARANGFAPRLTVIKGMSTHIALPQRADLVVADQIGNFGFEAGVLEFFADARKRLLKPGARAVPDSIDLYVAPVQQPEIWRRVSFWSRRPAGFSYAPARQIAENTGYPIRLAAREVLARPLKVARLDTLTHGAQQIRFEGECRAARAGSLHGLGGWFSAQLAPGVTLTNSPLARARILRRNVVLPIARPVAVKAGDRIRVALDILPKELMIRWTLEVRPSAGRGATQRFSHSTLKGMLIAEEDMARTRPDFVPVMSGWGNARRTVLELCDGRRALREIEAGVRRAHPRLFPSHGEAAAFVAEVVTRYAT